MKGQIPWNKGQRTSDAVRRKQSEARKRYFALHPEALVAQSQRQIGIKQSPETVAKRVSKNHGRKRTPEQRARIGVTKLGSRNRSWRGGISPLRLRLRNCSRYRQWRSLIFRRDNYTCQNCGLRGGTLDPHHEIPFSSLLDMLRQMTPQEILFETAISSPMLFDLTNGITLCRRCHKITDTFAKNTAYQI